MHRSGGDDEVAAMMVRPWRNVWIPRPRRLAVVRHRQQSFHQHLVRRLADPAGK